MQDKNYWILEVVGNEARMRGMMRTEGRERGAKEKLAGVQALEVMVMDRENVQRRE